MTHEPDYPHLQALRQRIEDLWQCYLDPGISEPERRRVGYEIDAMFDQLRHCPEWKEVFLSVEPWE